MLVALDPAKVRPHQVRDLDLTVLGDVQEVPDFLDKEVDPVRLELGGCEGALDPELRTDEIQTLANLAKRASADPWDRGNPGRRTTREACW
jgi:hypothetical protein